MKEVEKNEIKRLSDRLDAIRHQQADLSLVEAADKYAELEQEKETLETERRTGYHVQPVRFRNAPYRVGNAGIDRRTDAAGQHRTARPAADRQCKTKGCDLIWPGKSQAIPAKCASRP